MEELLKELKEIKDIIQKEHLPKLIYAKEIAQQYPVNLNKATEFCKRYGTNFGGYCIEEEKFKEILQTKGTDLFN